jgi:hypothetical protein
MKHIGYRKIVLILVVLIGGILLVSNTRRLEFEYYVWNLSSESTTDREYYSAKIISMGDYVVPMLIHKLDHQFIFETDYVVLCLEQITKATVTYEVGRSDLTKEMIPFWKEWWSKNRHKYD